MRPRPAALSALLGLLALVAAGCGPSSGSAGPLARAAPAPTTTAPPPVAVTGPPAAPPPSPPAPTSPPAAGDSPASSRPPVLVSPRGVVVPVLGRTDSGWAVRTPCGRTATLARGTAVNEATVVLDPGHGGREPGAVSPGGLAEAPVNLTVSRHAEEALRRAGVSVLLTRTGEYDLKLPGRAEIARALRPRAFVSIHHNAEPDGPWPRPGSETYYQIASGESKRLAGLIYEEVVRALTPYRVAWVADRDAGAKYRVNDRGGDYYAMLRLPADVTSVLVELAFISNPPEAELLARPDVAEVEGEAVARGILRFLTTQDPGSGYTVPYPRVDPPGGGGPGPPCVDPAL